MQSLPKVAIILALPLLFFATSAFAVLFSVSGFLISSSAEEPITVPYSSSALFGSLPPESDVLGETTVSQNARPTILKEFLESYHSPLAKYSDYMYSVSQEYDLDWRLLASIAGAESTFGRNIPENCYNAWGWGIHSRGTLCFSDWREGIRTVARGLREKFLNDGLTTVEQIMARYAPVSLSNGGSWAGAVSYFMNQLEHAVYYRQ